MKTAVQIRPEQAAVLGQLDAEAKAAKERFAIALGTVLAGLVPDGAKLVGVAKDGTVTVEVPDGAAE